MNEPELSQRDKRADLIIIAGFAFGKFLIHAATNAFGGYGYFRDELYYLACSEHIDLGYVDQPPLSIYILAVNRFLLGDSIFALRFLPAVAGAATVLLTGLMVREFGGRKFALILACIASIASPIVLGMDTVFTMNAFDYAIWAGAAYLIIRLIKTGDPRHWLVLGVVIGLGLFNKIGVVWLACGIIVGLLFTPLRHWVKTRWPWISAVIAFLIFVPYIIWNFTHDFAHLEFIRNATSGKYSSLTPLVFTIGQVMLQNPVSLPIWLTGIVLFLFAKEWREYRILGVIYVLSFIILLVNQHSKPEYLSPAYPALFAGGAIGLERLLSNRPWRWVKPVYSVLLVISGIVLAPLVLPVLPVETYIGYAEALGVKPTTAEAKKLEKLPQFYADMFGWEEKAEAVARVYNTLSKEEQAKCAIYGDNYGRCGAIDFFGRKYGLPKSVGRHNSYWIWGPRGYSGELMIVLGGGLKDKQEKFESVEVGGVVACKYCMPYENNLSIFVCRKLKAPLVEVWPQLKVYE